MTKEKFIEIFSSQSDSSLKHAEKIYDIDIIPCSVTDYLDALVKHVILESDTREEDIDYCISQLKDIKKTLNYGNN